MNYKSCKVRRLGEHENLLGEVIVPLSFLARARGLLGRPELNENQGMLFLNCNAVHMFGMRFAIDVVFLDAAWEVVRCVSGVRPWRVAASRNAASTLEVRRGTIERLGLVKGMTLECRM